MHLSDRPSHGIVSWDSVPFAAMALTMQPSNPRASAGEPGGFAPETGSVDKILYDARNLYCNVP